MDRKVLLGDPDAIVRLPRTAGFRITGVSLFSSSLSRNISGVAVVDADAE